MNEDGNHGGSDTGETESALVFASPRFRTMRVKTTYECPTLPSNGTGFDYYRKVEQQDLVPTLSALLGLPVPRNSIGRTLSELQGIWPNGKSYVRVLARNAEQLWNVAHSIFDTLTAHKEEPSCSRNMSQQRTASPNQCMDSNNTAGKLAYLLASAEQQTLRSNNMQQWTKATVAYEESLAQAQQAIIKGNRSFDLTRMAAGIALCSLAMIACCCSIGTPWPSPAISVSCAFIAVAYGFALIMSTSEKNEQYFWYLVTPAWILFLAARAIRRTQDARLRYHFVWNVIRILMSHCITVCWPFLRSVIEETMFAGHKPLMWSMLIITHLWISVKIVQHTFTGIVTGVTALSLTTPLVSTAFIFKVGQEFEHAGGITSPFGIDQISLFRTLLGLTWLAATITYITVTRQRSRSVAASKLPYRLHHLLTLILMAQSRVPKLPLFICLDHQRSCLQTVLQLLSFPPPNPTDQQRNRTNDTTKPSSIYMAITILTFSHSSFFFLGGSNSISTIDLSNAFNGITTYNILTVGVLLFCANWTGPIWWSSAACSLVEESARNPTESLLGADNKDLSDSSMPTPNETDEFLQQAHRQDQPWLSYLSTMSTLMAAITLIVMIICTLQREHHTVWVLWGSKYLYSVFWVLEWHIVVSLILGSCLRALRSF